MAITWNDIEPVKVDDIQTGRVACIETVAKDGYMFTKCSADKIISCFKEGFVLMEKWINAEPGSGNFPNAYITDWASVSFYELLNGAFALNANGLMYYSDPNGDLSKPFSSLNPYS